MLGTPETFYLILFKIYNGYSLLKVIPAAVLFSPHYSV